MDKNLASPLDPAIIVIFGITGDLAQRYLLPSLYHLFKAGQLHPKTRIIGVTRGTMTTEELFEKVELCVNEVDNICDPAALAAMHSQTSMHQMDLEDAKGYQNLLEVLEDIDEELGMCLNRLYYLSIPPQAYSTVIDLLGQTGLNKGCRHGKAASRLLVEKPFGFDLKSAEELIARTNKHFTEDQIFRIDHYMAKETVQNILTFRFKNPIFEPLWNNQHIASIEISAKEKIGIEGRATFYEPLGALRDFIQSHLIQILGIITMEQPASLDSDNIHSAKQAALEAVRPVAAAEISEMVVRGQYESYKTEVKNPTSTTETYAAVTVFVDNKRWENVPITMVTGKALNERKTEITITFHSKDDEASNKLRFRIQPNEGVELDLVSKKPGYFQDMQAMVMDFSYQNKAPEAGHPSAYERVLADAVRGDHTLFATSQEVLAGWRILQPVLDAWQRDSSDLKLYPSGSEGP